MTTSRSEPPPEALGKDLGWRLATAESRQLDTALILALREGHGEFLRFVRGHTATLADAEDILQEFYLKVVRGIGTLRGAEKLKGWLARVLRRTITDHYRRAAVRKRLDERLYLLGDPSVLIDDAAEQAVCGCLYRLLPSLPRDCARVLWRVDLLGEPRKRVARSLGVSQNTLDVRLHRARRALRGALERYCTTCTVHGFLSCACERTREPVRFEAAKSLPPERETATKRRLRHG